jgi:hypothetical protein
VRAQVRREPETTAELPTTWLDALRDRYLVRTEQRAGSLWFELAHDRLVGPVERSNEAWERTHLHPVQVQAKLWEAGKRSPGLYLSERALADATRWAEANAHALNDSERDFLRLSTDTVEAERRQRAQRRRSFYALALVALLATLSAIAAMFFYGDATQNEAAARQAERDAEAAQIQAELQRIEAEKQQLLASLLSYLADRQRRAADAARIEAERATAVAREEKSAAEAAQRRVQDALDELKLERASAQSRALARAARAADSAVDRALLAGAAWDAAPTPEARDVLVDAVVALLRDPKIGADPVYRGPRAELLDVEGSQLLVGEFSWRTNALLARSRVGGGGFTGRSIAVPGRPLAAHLLPNAVVLALTQDRTVFAWDARTATQLAPAYASSDVDWTDLAASGEAAVLLAAGPARVQRLDASRLVPRGPVRELPGPQLPSVDAALRMAATVADGRVHLTDLASGRSRTVPGITTERDAQVTLHPSGTSVAVQTPRFAGVADDNPVFHQRLEVVDARGGDAVSFVVEEPGAELRAWAVDGLAVVHVPSTYNTARRLAVWDPAAGTEAAQWPVAAYHLDVSDVVATVLWEGDGAHYRSELPLTWPGLRAAVCTLASRNLQLERWEEALPGASYTCICPDAAPPPRLLRCP